MPDTLRQRGQVGDLTVLQAPPPVHLPPHRTHMQRGLTHSGLESRTEVLQAIV